MSSEEPERCFVEADVDVLFLAVGFTESDAESLLIQHDRLIRLAAGYAGEVAEVINCQRDVDGATFTNGFTYIKGFQNGEPIGIGFQRVGDLQQCIGAFCG